MVGQNIGKYRVLDRVGRGGMGTVFRALDETLNREVAIKILNAELNDPEVARRFRAEAVTVARLNHPGIATIYELFQHDGQWMMVMEFVRGETLERMVERLGPLSAQRAADLCMQALTALSHAHRMGVVHRDLKPANLMITESGAVKIMDFGIARVAGSEHLTSAGFLMGTPAYMAPEQVTGGEIDARTDLYAMGVVLYHLVTAKLPFKGDTPIAMAQSRVSGEPTPVRQVRDGLPAWIDPLLERALAKASADRFQSADQFREALRRGLAGLPMQPQSEAEIPPELVATVLPGTMASPPTPPARPIPATPTPVPAGTAAQAAPPVAATPPSGAPRPAATGAVKAPTTATPAAPGPATGQVTPPAAPSLTAVVKGPTAPVKGPTAAVKSPTAAVPGATAATKSATAATKGATAATKGPTAATKGPTPPTASLPSRTVLALGAAAVVLAILVGWMWYRSRHVAPAAATAVAETVTTPTPPPPVPADTSTPSPTPAGALPPPPVADATAPANSPSTSPAATPAATPGPRAAAPPPPAGSPAPTASASAATPTPAATGSPTPPPAVTGRAATPGSRGASAAVDRELVTFGDVKVLRVRGQKSDDEDVVLSFVSGQISIASKKGGATIVSETYKRIAHATYVHAKTPKWDPGLPGPPANLDVPGILRSTRHWFVLQSKTSYLILRLDDSNWQQILDTFELRTGLAVDRPAAADK